MKCKGKEALGKAGRLFDTISKVFKNDTQVNNAEAVKNFYRKVKTEPFEKLEAGIDIGVVNNTIASKIKKHLGLNIEGFRRILTRDGFIHIKRKHGEGSVDPRPITEDDMLKYEDIVTNPDKIARTKTPQRLDSIMYMKRLDDTVYIVEEIRGRKKNSKVPYLTPKTMFKNKISSKDLDVFEGNEIKWVDLKSEGHQTMDALADANRPSHVRNAPDTPSSNGIIQQTRWENQVDRFTQWLGRTYAKGEKAVVGRITGGNINNILAVKQAAKDIYEITNDFKIAQEQMNAHAKEVMDFINKSIGEEDRLALFRTLNGDMSPDELPVHMISTYEKFRKLIDTNAQALVDAGALKEKYKIDDYLKRYYKQYIDTKDGFMKNYFDNFKARKNLTEDERIALGMVQDAGFAIANTLKEQRVQLIKANMLKTLADRFGKDVEFADSVFIPDSTLGGGVKRYGALAGKWVDKEIADALFGSAVLKKELEELGDFNVKLGSLWIKAVDHIKINVTVKNPMTHVYNVGSNMILSYLHGNMTYLAKALHMRVANRAKFNEWVKRANAQGLNSYLGDMEKMIDELSPKAKEPIYLTILKNLYFSKGSKTGDFARRAYDWEDKIFKLAQFMENIEKRGMDDKTAMKLAQESYVNYSTPLPAFVRVMDKSGLMPFLHYSYKATPMVFKTILKHPVKFAVLQAAMIGSGASAWFGDNDIGNARKPQWAQNGKIANLLGVNSWTEMPFADRWYLNSGRLVPGFRFDGFDLIPGGFLRGVFDIMHGESTLGYKLDKEDDDAGTKILKRTTEMALSKAT